jgi:hypothetical protein
LYLHSTLASFASPVSRYGRPVTSTTGSCHALRMSELPSCQSYPVCYVSRHRIRCRVLLCCMVGLRLGGRCVLISCLAPPTLRNIMQQLCIVSFLLVLPAIAAQQYVAFDAASASSTYSVGNLAGSPAFAAQQALSGGSGYWQNVFEMNEWGSMFLSSWYLL